MTDPTATTTSLPERASVKVWDPFVRVFHWSLVSLFVFCFASGDLREHPHEWAGYAILALVGGRIVWGLIGPGHARFSDFLNCPSVVAGFLCDSLRFRERRYLGHNPAGGAMVIALISAITVICATGIMMDMDAFWREAWVEDRHVGAT